MTNAVRKLIWSVDSGLPVFAAGSMETVVANSVAERRFTMLLFAAFAAVALGLAIVGLYGVLAYAVVQRSRELGMRLALGAVPTSLIWLVMKDGLRLTLGGLSAGAIGGAILALAMSRLLFGIRSLDVFSFAGAAALLLLTAALASFIPGLRAARLDPVAALRCE